MKILLPLFARAQKEDDAYELLIYISLVNQKRKRGT
jgi:hypothetical protein